MTHAPNARFVEAVLADPSHRVPLPDRGGRHFLAEGETVDTHHPFYAALLADRSLILKPAAVPDALEDEPAVAESLTADRRPDDIPL